MLEGFSFTSPGIANQLTGELATLAKYNALRIPADYFEEAMGKLREKYLNVPVDMVLHPASSTARRVVKAQQTAARRAPRVSESALSAQEWFEQGFIATDPDEELRCYSEAIRLAPDSFAAYYNRGAALYDKGDLDGAVDDMSEAIRLKPDLAAAYVGRGVAHYDRWFKRGISREAQVDLDAALQDFNDAIRVDPGFARAYFERGKWHRVAGNPENALNDLNEAIRLDPHNAAGYRIRAEARRAMGDPEGAKQDEKAAKRIERKAGK